MMIFSFNFIGNVNVHTDCFVKLYVFNLLYTELCTESYTESYTDVHTESLTELFIEFITESLILCCKVIRA